MDSGFCRAYFIIRKAWTLSRIDLLYRIPSSTKRPKVGDKSVSYGNEWNPWRDEITAWWNPLRRIKRIWFHFLRSGRFHYKTLVLWFHRSEGTISLYVKFVGFPVWLGCIGFPHPPRTSAPSPKGRLTLLFSVDCALFTKKDICREVVNALPYDVPIFI